MRKLIIFLFIILSLHAEDEYRLGEGVQIASLPIYVGGYFSSDYKKIDKEERYRLDDVAFMSYGSYGKFSYLAELEFKEFYVQTYRDDKKDVNSDTHLYRERIYADYNMDENYKFRVGKYNSPVGFWNLLPINVLRETTSSPVSSDLIFPRFTTGASASYSSYNSGELKMDVMVQNNKDIDDAYNNYKINKHYGYGILFDNNSYSVKLNSGFFHRVDIVNEAFEDELFYILFSAKVDREDYQLQSEIGSQASANGLTTAYAGYVQYLYRFKDEHSGVVRLEAYDDRENSKKDNIAIIGYTYRPLYPIALKSEYQFHTLKEENQLLLSLSVLF